MTPKELLVEIDRILEDSKTALLATVDEAGRPCLRWMTPRRLKTLPTHLCAVCEVGTSKVDQIRHHPEVAWQIQRPTLDVVITLRGRAAVIEDPAMLQEFLDVAAKDLFVIWRLHPPGAQNPFAVIETLIESASRFDSLSGKTTEFRFDAS
ncbi:MAG: pyridoxamine 5'-phosphate oxidase family protein [Polyangiaceae bacterium]|jgi:pyridoxamine 5'-phosphate oxidase